VFMVPPFAASGNLPPGVHWATWEEITERFGTTPHRAKLVVGLRKALQSLASAGCRTVYIDGSFVTAKEVPGDFDACWDPIGTDASLLDPVLLDFSNKRAAQKAKYGGEFFLSSGLAAAGRVFLDFFQLDKSTGEAKGIIAIDLQKVSL
jgi:uncharacterized protein DUF6932